MWLTRIRTFISELDQSEFRKFMVIYVAAFLVCSGGLIFFYVSQEVGTQEQLKKLNKARKKVQKVLTDYQKVAKQKESVAQILSADKNFYLQQFTQSALQAVDIESSTVGKVSSKSLRNGYTEESVAVQLSNVNTQELCALLQNIEQASRVYVKKVTINRDVGATAINVNMEIATLKQSDG